jgi:glycosyltransferase involved in cell wall biosynthesis
VDIKSLSVYIIACNEEIVISRCIESCNAIADEVIIVVNDTTDKTVEIAESCGAKVFFNDWTNHRDQKAFAMTKCSNDWVLNIDADECLSVSLHRSIKKFLESSSNEFVGCSFNRKSYFLGKWIKYGEWYPDRKVRLCQKSKGRWSGLTEHDLLKINGRVKFLEGDLLHYSYGNINELTEKTIYFSDKFVARVSKSKNVRFLSALEIIFRSTFRFFRGYFLKLGFLDGLPGLLIAINSAHFVFLKYIKLRFEVKVDNKSI